MLGSTEILIILVVLAFVVVPFFQKRNQARQVTEKKSPRKVKSYAPPEARSVDYEDD